MRHNSSLKYTIAVLILLSCAPSLSQTSSANSYDKVLTAVVKAHGADKALSCNSISLGMDVLTDPTTGLSYDGHIFIKPDRFRLEYKMDPTFTYRMGFDGNQAWLIASPKATQAKKLDLLQTGLFKFYSLIFSTRWLGYLRAQGGDLKYNGQESYRGIKTEILQANVDTVGYADFLIDANTHLLKAIRFNFPGESQPHYEIVYESYTDQNGVKIPARIDIFRNKLHYRSYKVKEAKLCQNIDDAVFASDLK